MNRKIFLQSFISTSIATMLAAKGFGRDKPCTVIKAIPTYLKQGDIVGTTCPAGNVELAQIQPCIHTLKLWGLNVQIGKTVGTQWQRFGGTDEERTRDFQTMLDDENISAIIFGKGGYGCMRIIDRINWSKFQQKPKWLVGYSDLTMVHLHIHANMQIPTIHGDMCTGFSADPSDISTTSLEKALFGARLGYHIPNFYLNRKGQASGQLVGGNLSLLHAAAGSKSDIDTEGKILFIEDVSEFKYTIDRMMMSLKRSGKLDKLAGLVAGCFTSTKESAEERFNMPVEEIILDKVKEYSYPVCFHFPAGHIKENRALKFGVNYNLSITEDDVLLSEDMNTTSIKNLPYLDTSAYTKTKVLLK